MELGWANSRSIPIVLVSDDSVYYEHPLIHHAAGWIVHDLDAGITVVNSVLGAYGSKEIKRAYPEVIDVMATQNAPQMRYA
jgi:hypothetical protein